MVLESTIICVDNSQFMRNGDFLPTRCLPLCQTNVVSVIPLIIVLSLKAIMGYWGSSLCYLTLNVRNVSFITKKLSNL